jgi:hypothetical protein
VAAMFAYSAFVFGVRSYSNPIRAPSESVTTASYSFAYLEIPFVPSRPLMHPGGRTPAEHQPACGYRRSSAASDPRRLTAHFAGRSVSSVWRAPVWSEQSLRWASTKEKYRTA